MPKFHWLEKLELDDPRTLTIRIAELLASGPAELLPHGLASQPMTPIAVTAGSRRYQVQFRKVGAFRVVPEPFNEVSDRAERLGDFLFQEIGSSYLLGMTDAARIGGGIPDKGNLFHYVVYAENHVVHVLTGQAPSIISVPAVGP